MSSTGGSSLSSGDRAHALERLFAEFDEGLFSGLLSTGPDRDITIAINPSLSTLLGSEAASPSDTLRPFAHDRFVVPGVRAELIRRLLAEGRVHRYPIRLRRVDGSEVPVTVTARAVPMDGTWLRVDAAFHAQSGAADSLSPDAVTMAGIAHELNNPLATIVSWSEALLERPLDHSTHHAIGIVLAEARRAARIARALLTLGQNRQSTRALVDLNTIVADTLALRAGEQQRARIVPRTDLADALPPVFADGSQLQQVLLNLVINAEQAMSSAHGNGTLSIRTWYDREHRTVGLAVHDTGPGLAPHVKTRVFDPFVTTKTTGEGTGLGLTVAQTIVQEHGGTIHVHSEAGSGTLFVVELPAGGHADRVTAETGADLAGARILLVEDERRLAAAMEQALSNAGGIVDHAGDGEEALARVRQIDYDVIICDLQLPRVNGMMLYRAIAAATPAVARRVIFVTGEVAGTDAARFLAESGCRSVAKPFRFADLLRAVRETLA